MPTARDYDRDPDRCRLGLRVTSAHQASGADLHARIVVLLQQAGLRTVLDVGCGAGGLAVAAAGSGLRVLGADAATTMTYKAREHGPTMRADVTALPVADAAVDAVAAVNVLDHLERPEVALREAHRVLRPGGLVVDAGGGAGRALVGYVTYGADSLSGRGGRWSAHRRRWLTEPWRPVVRSDGRGRAAPRRHPPRGAGRVPVAGTVLQPYVRRDRP